MRGLRWAPAAEYFELEADRAFYRPVGVVSFDECVARVRAAIERACREGASDLLVDITEVTGFSSPSLFERFLVAVDWAHTAMGRLRLGMVARPEMIHPEKFGILVARNRNLEGNIFPTQAETRAWLDDRRATSG